jgi:hypothetical protein
MTTKWNHEGDDMINGKEWAAVIVASFVVIAFVAAGFTQAVFSAVYGKPIVFGSDWFAAMLSLSSAAVGWLMGKKQDNGPGVQSAIDTSNIEAVNISQTSRQTPGTTTTTVTTPPAPVATKPVQPPPIRPV